MKNFSEIHLLWLLHIDKYHKKYNPAVPQAGWLNLSDIERDIYIYNPVKLGKYPKYVPIDLDANLDRFSDNLCRSLTKNKMLGVPSWNL